MTYHGFFTWLKAYSFQMQKEFAFFEKENATYILLESIKL